MNATQTKQLTAAFRDEIERSTWQFMDRRAEFPKEVADNVVCIFIVRRPADRPIAGDKISEVGVSMYRFRGIEFRRALYKYNDLCAERFVEIVAESDVNAELERRKKVIP